MTYDKVILFRKKQTHQCDDDPFEKIFIHFKGRYRFDGTIWNIHTTGLSLYSGSREIREQIADTREKDSVYSQDIIECCSTFKRICQIYWPIIKRYNHTSFKGISQQGRLMWLRKGFKEESRSNTIMIVYQIERCLKSIVYWFQFTFYPLMSLKTQGGVN